MTTTVRFRERAGRAWLEVDYDGLTPPHALFDDLAMVGWSPPPPAPPPAEALDWSRPDPETGRRCSIRPFRVVGARVGAPPGTGAGGTWTSGERTAFVATLEGILRRHRDTTPLDEPARPVGEPSPSAEGTGLVDLSILVPLAVVPTARAHLEALGLEVAVEQAVLEVARSYRGNTFVEQVPGQRLGARVGEERLDEVLDGVGEALGIDPRGSDRVTVTRVPPPGVAAAGVPAPGGRGLRLVS